MKRTVIGFLAGFLLAAALAWGAVAKAPKEPYALHSWTGDGARPGLYYVVNDFTVKPGQYRFYECRPLGPAKVTPPPH